jgi:pimeloyl-ACP methyl ester carboxylesterase
VNLEVLFREAKGAAPHAPLLFVHGAYVGAWCWEAHFLDWFAVRGYAAHAVSLRGHGGSAGRRELNDFGLADYAEDVARAVESLPQAPVLIGHSMGAMVVQKYLEKAEAPAAVLACPVPSYGLMPSSVRLAWTRPALFAGLNAVASGGRASPEVLEEALFAGAIGPERLEQCYQRMQRESRRALLDMSGWGLPSLFRAVRAPTLVLGAEKDNLIAHGEARATASMIGADYRLLAGLGHAIMLDEGWESAAEAILGWLGEKGL